MHSREVITWNVRVKAVFDGEWGVSEKEDKVVSGVLAMFFFFFFNLNTGYMSVCDNSLRCIFFVF